MLSSILKDEIEKKKKGKKRKYKNQTSSQPKKKRKVYKTKKQREIEIQKEEKDKKNDKKNSKIEETNNNNNNGEENSQLSNSSDIDVTEKVPTYPREEVIRRLRAAGRVVTFFGETDYEREKRWMDSQTDGEHVEEYTKGSKNDLDQILRQLDKEQEEEVAKGGNEEDKDLEKIKNLKPYLTDEEILADQLNEHEIVFITLKNLLKIWEYDLTSVDISFRRSSKGKKTLATFQQTKSYLKPLFRRLKKKTISNDILNYLVKICFFLRDREYIKASDIYLQMSIGNAPWPIGVTMVGIHARTARQKISAESIAHVLNNETDRKFIQSVKRIMTWCQTKYPTDPSKTLG